MLLALTSSSVYCSDPKPLQDFCVAVKDINGVYVNGRFCKDPKLVKEDDFFFSGLNIPGNITNRLGSKITVVDVESLPGLNTLGVTLARTDYALGGQVPPHLHPRGSEILLVLQGTLYVGFVTSYGYKNRLFSKILYPGDVFVFPVGLIHFHVNIGKTNAVTISAVGSQEPGLITVGKAVFGSNLLIDSKVLSRAFALDLYTVKYLQGLFSREDGILDN